MRIKSQDFTGNYLFFSLENKYNINLMPISFKMILR